MSAAALLQNVAGKPKSPGNLAHPGLLLQRKCACGAPTSSLSGECVECKSKKRLQTKLTIGASNDPLEQEADRVADQVMAAAENPAVRGASPRIQRFTGQATEQVDTVPASVDRVLAGSGRPLEPTLQEEMEQRFGHDFSRVRVHSSAAAEQSVRDVNANAYTVGHNIVFGSGRFAPSSHEGLRLIAHELTHVVQQSGSDGIPVGQGNGDGNRFAYSHAAQAAASSRQLVTTNDTTSVYLARAPLTSATNGGAGEQVRTQRIQRAFTPKLSSDAGTALIEVMSIIESIRPSESASGMYLLVSDGEIITITQVEYDRIRASAQKTLLDSLRKVRRKTEDAQRQYEAQHDIDEDQWIVSGAVRLFGGIDDPGETIRQDIRFATVNANAAQVFIERGQLVRGAQFFVISERFSTTAKKTSQAYVNNVISTADSTVTVLEVTAGAAAATVLVIAVVLAAPVVIPAIAKGAAIAASAARAAPLVFSLGTAAVPAAAPVVAVEAAAVAVPAAAAVAVPAAAAVAVPAAAAVAVPAAAAVAVPAAAAVAVPAAAAVAVPAAAASSTLSTAALAMAGLAVASTTLSSDSPKPVDAEKEKKEKKKRPPFVLRLPQQKAPHLGTYLGWLGALQSDPNYVRGSPAQLERWHQALRIGGSHAIPASVYERGHALGLAGEVGERRIRVPNWSRTKSTPMEVDHIIELQVTPAPMREEFNSMSNYELLDRTSNGTSGPLLAANIASERAKQVAFDPSAAARILRFDQVVLDGGTKGERWSPADLQTGKQLDAYDNHVSP